MKINTMLQCTEEAESYRILLSHITQVRRCTAVKQTNECSAVHFPGLHNGTGTAQHVYYSNKSCSGDSVVQSARG